MKDERKFRKGKRSVQSGAKRSKRVLEKRTVGALYMYEDWRYVPNLCRYTLYDVLNCVYYKTFKRLYTLHAKWRFFFSL